MGLFGNRYSQGAGRVPSNPFTVGEKELNESRTGFPAPSTNPVVITPQPPGSDMGNMGYDPLPGMLKDDKFKALYYSVPEDLRSLVQQEYARTRNVGDIDVNQLLTNQLQRRRTNLELNKLEREQANFGKPEAETAAERMLGQILGRVPTFEEQQKALEKAANKRFQYDMMGRIPETIIGSMGAQGRLMNEGASKIADIVSGTRLPTYNVPQSSLRTPTFRYFGNK